jgi:hypothetical protein
MVRTEQYKMFKMTGLYDLNRAAKTKRMGPKFRGGTENTEERGYSDDVR